ncbi:MAG: hypothetical protein HZA50_12205 [Planctomycetes bacterium]|nr:hypothetical protein [Planctomycetota bacterium]
MKAYKTTVPILLIAAFAACWNIAESGGARAEGSASSAATAAASQPASATSQPIGTAPAEGKAAKLLAVVGRDAEPLMEKIDGGMIDWANGQVLAVGTCKVNGPDQSDVAMAARGATLVAARNAALMLAGLKVDKNGRFEQVESGQVNVDAVLKNYRADEPVHDKNNKTVSVSIRLPIYGAGGLVRVNGAAAGCVKWNWQDHKPAAAAPILIIIDARECGVAPGVRTVVVAASGKVLLDAGELAGGREGPAVIFARAGQDGKELVIRSQDVIVIKARRDDGRQKCSIVLSDEQVQKLPAQAKDLMIEGKVVIVSESVGGK